MSGQPTVIYSAANTQQAYLLRGLLEEEGIAARVVNDAVQIAGGELPLGWNAAARVVVPVEDAARARKFAEEFDAKAALGPHGELESAGERLAGEAEATQEGWQWPRCPECGLARTAQCPACGELATDFPVAEYQPGATPDRVMLVCRGCDDSITPAWYRHCAGCGHDFGVGLVTAQSQRPGSYFSGAAMAVVGLLVGGGLLFAAYFWWLLS